MIWRKDPSGIQAAPSRRRRYGLGDVVAAIAQTAGVRPCDDCVERRDVLNAATDAAAEKVFGGQQTDEVRA